MGSVDAELRSAATSRRYSPEQKDQAVRMVLALRAELGTTAETVSLVARQLGCRAAPCAYWASKRRPPSARALRDAMLMPVLLALWQASYSVYGARKLWVADLTQVGT